MTIGLLLSNGANHQHVVSISIFVAVLCLSVVSGHRFRQSRWTSQSAAAILIVIFCNPVKTIFALNFILFILVSLGRAAFVFPFSVLSNFISSDAERSTLTLRHQVIIWWAGLTRGAVSIALAYKQFDINEQQEAFHKEELILPLLSSEEDLTSSSFVLVRRSLSALLERPPSISSGESSMMFA